MRKTKIGFVAALLIALFVPLISAAAEAPTDVMEVVIIDQTGASEPFAPMFDRFSEVYKAQDSAAVRSMWFNAYAGQQSNVLIVSLRYPSLAAFAADGGVVPSPAYQALAQEFQQKGFRVVSRSLSFQGR